MYIITAMKTALLVLCLIAVSFQIETKVWDKAGSYTLTPEDYGFQT